MSAGTNWAAGLHRQNTSRTKRTHVANWQHRDYKASIDHRGRSPHSPFLPFRGGSSDHPDSQNPRCRALQLVGRSRRHLLSHLPAPPRDSSSWFRVLDYLWQHVSAQLLLPVSFLSVLFTYLTLFCMAVRNLVAFVSAPLGAFSSATSFSDFSRMVVYALRLSRYELIFVSSEMVTPCVGYLSSVICLSSRSISRRRLATSSGLREVDDTGGL